MRTTARAAARVQRAAGPGRAVPHGAGGAGPAGPGEPPHLPPHVHLLRLLPTPKGTPFTFCYLLLLAVTTVLTEIGDPAAVSRWLAGSSTDVQNLAKEPLFVLVASALIYQGALLSPYVLGFVLALTGLERRVGGWRTAVVFVAGHVLATLATQLTVAAAVALEHLPESSLTRLQYGITCGVLACAGALAGVLRVVWARWLLLAAVTTVVVAELVSLTDPVTDWSHLLALLTGIALWPPLRRYQRTGSAAHPRPAVP
ncbi:rhomboid-like protein [Streptomyces sp. TRM 70351]|uniref:rhomboid-like protein n=1 Tax=Streptomyces sp. TRM 70351 TaxID=3116552 RepID=UPI002E7C351A|nr:rhomboid-like protein [Streptomyces sp. TRM 70351]MEE1927613.1 rhomboid-like protein [Streptomyces sp. TRM 70351]